MNGNGGPGDGWMYLHENGALIWKRFRPQDESPFVMRIWKLETDKRENAWTIVLEALALGADHVRVRELADHWGLTLEDLPRFLIRESPSDLLVTGLRVFLAEIREVDAHAWFEWLNSHDGMAVFDLDYDRMPRGSA